MKKSNIIILSIAAVVSVFLLVLWFVLGFNHVDSPIDPLVTLVWWLVIVAAALIINKVEGSSREKIRSVYVSDGQLFNSEVGLEPRNPAVPLEANVAQIVENLDYGFEKKDFPEADEFQPKLLVRTTEFKREKQDDGQQQPAGAQRVKWCSRATAAIPASSKPPKSCEPSWPPPKARRHSNKPRARPPAGLCLFRWTMMPRSIIGSLYSCQKVTENGILLT